jgi:hypothetical protein
MRMVWTGDRIGPGTSDETLESKRLEGLIERIQEQIKLFEEHVFSLDDGVKV